MDCHDVRLLLAFLRRGGDQLDPTERAAVQQHLQTCPDCTALADSERAADAAFGAAMRAVPVPADAKARLLARLAAGRPRRWPGVAAAAAAALLLAVGLGFYAHSRATKPVLLPLAEIATIDGRTATSAADVEEWFRQAGVAMTFPRQYSSNQLLTYDVVQYEGRRVPKLVFFNSAKGAAAQILVLPNDQFRVQAAAEEWGRGLRLPDTAHTLQVEEGTDCVYVVFFAGGGPDAFLGNAPH